MKFKLIALAALPLGFSLFAAEENPQSVKDLLNRVGGDGTAEKIITILDDSYKSTSGAEMFKISARDGKPCITGTTLSALTSGIGWYLNHTVNVNLAWNNPYPDLSVLPLPAVEEEHTSAADYRYYLNYTAFSYSMSTWTWERWQQEIDWMALHGINMPLQIVGLEEVWRKFLMEDYNYTQAEVNDFVGGPCFMAWFGMNNLQGHGGPNPDWWYERQAQLGKQINERMKSLGIEPVLPGFAGMVPSDFTKKTGIAATTQGNWCGFVRPYIVDSTGDKFADVAANYYKRLKEIMGESRYYSIDPYHEGGAAPANPGQGYKKMAAALEEAQPGAKWVIQSWQWSAAQRTCLDNINKGTLIVLDLYSDGNPQWNTYKGHDTVYSTIFNFGGRTGFFGRFNGVIDGYFNARSTASVKGIGASPEAIEQTPVMYDLLYELPWMESKPDAAAWIADYAKRRYSADSSEAEAAWELLRNSALDCRTSLQGPHEAVLCARPALTVNKVSSWGGAEIFYNRADVVNAAYYLLDANLSGLNYSFDLTDITRQALTDYSKSLLAGIKEAYDTGNTELFNARRDAFLQLILDIDKLLNSNSEFMLGHWTKRARAMADEISGTSDSDRDWLELDNARTLITTWGGRNQAESGGLRDYSYREWGGMMAEYYYQRWKTWFDNNMNAPEGGWFQWEWNWAHDKSTANKYEDKPQGDTRAIAAALLPKYLTKLSSALDGQASAYIDRLLSNDFRKVFFDRASPENDYIPSTAGAEVSEIAIDLNRNGLFDESETQTGGKFRLEADVPVGERNCRVKLSDGTVILYTLKILVDITEPRTVSVKSADPAQGSVSILGSNATSVTNTDVVSLLASPAPDYDFDFWTDAAGNNIGNDNPMNYYGKEAAEFTAHFVINKWGVPEYNGNADELATMKSYRQYIDRLSVTQGGETVELYSADECPDEHFVRIPTRIKAAPGNEFTFEYSQPGDGMQYLFLSAYADLDNDGEFNTSNELIGTIGTHNATNAAVGAGKFTILLPFDAVKGTTHIRLRFDGAWGPGYDETIKAFPPKASTNRIIYELILEVTDAAEFVSEVTVSSSNPTLGSVRSENEATNLYAPGENVILTAFPTNLAKLSHWVDNHGRTLPREWMTDNSITFKPYDNAQITAIFEPIPLSGGDFKLNWEPMDDGSARITGIAPSADGGVLDLTATEVPVGSINADAFGDQKNEISRIVLPDREFVSDSGKQLFSAEIIGDGTQNKSYTVNPTIAGSMSWRITLRGSNNGTSFNEYGSAIYANGTNCLASDYSNGWSQFYITKGGELNIKWDSATAVRFTDVSLLGAFTIVADFDAKAKTLTVTASAGGKSQTKVIRNSSVMKDISRFVTAIPTGMTYTLTFSEPSAPVKPGEIFRNFHKLLSYSVKGNNPLYIIEDGVAYNKADGLLAAFPEGRLFSYPFSFGAYADPDASGENLTVSADATENELTGLWSFDYDLRLRHCNSGLALNTTTFTLAYNPNPINYEIIYGAKLPTLRLKSSNKYIAIENGRLALSASAKDLKLTSSGATIEVTAPSKIFTLCLPYPVTPRGFRIYALTDISAESSKLEPLKGAASYMPFIVAGVTPGYRLTFGIPTESTADVNTPMLGTTVELPFPGDFYLMDSDGYFNLHTSGNVPANSAYLLKSELPEGLPDKFSEISEIRTDSSNTTIIYDLQGRKISKPSKGIFIIDGSKTLIK